MTEEINWKNEKENLSQGIERNWWKPTAGQHIVVFLSDGEKYEATYEEKVIPKIRFEIETNKERFDWGVTIGKTENSLYGQLALLGNQWGKLLGNKITLIVKGSGKDVSYAVVESLGLMTQKEEVKTS